MIVNIATLVNQALFDLVEGDDVIAAYISASLRVLLSFTCLLRSSWLIFLHFFFHFILGVSTQPSSYVTCVKEFGKELEDYRNMMKLRDRTIDSLQDQVFDLNGEFECSRLLHAATEKALVDTGTQYGRVFDKKKTIMLEEIKQGKMTKQLQSEVKSSVDIFKG